MTTQGMKKTAFLDTNALIRLFGFWEACEVAKVSMDSVTDWKDLRCKLKGNRIPIVGAFEEGDFGEVRDGLVCFKSLSQARCTYDYFTCQVSHSEMHRTILSSRATEKMSRRRVPRSLRNKRPLIVHRTVLKNEDYRVIDDQMNEFFECLSIDHGIRIPNLEESSSGVTATTILMTAKAIWSRVLIETMDAYIYAAAVECEADFFLTGDSALRQAAINLNKPSGEWTFAERALRKALGKPTNFRFPKGVRLSHMLN